MNFSVCWRGALSSVLFLSAAVWAAGVEDVGQGVALPGESVPQQREFSWQPRSVVAQVWVSVQGDDERGTGTREAPLASLGRALEVVAQAREDGLVDPQQVVEVVMGAGEYVLEETVVFGLEHGNISVVAQDALQGDVQGQGAAGVGASGSVRLSSALPLEGWERVTGELEGLPAAARGKVWRLDLSERGANLAEDERFGVLYQQGEVLRRARTRGFVPGRLPADEDAELRNDFWVLFPPGVLQDWQHLPDVDLVTRTNKVWIINFLPIEAIDTERNLARVAMESTYSIQRRGRSNQPTCWVENVIEGLDEPGEWVHDTREQVLYLWPKGDSPVAVARPVLNELIRVEGRNVESLEGDVPVEGVRFRGLSFTGADWRTIRADDSTFQHEGEIYDADNALLRFRGVKDCVVADCSFVDSGSGGLRADLYAQQVQVMDCEFTRLGGNGVLFAGYGPGLKDVNHSNVIYNNHIHDVARIMLMYNGIFLWQSGDNVVARNRVHDLPYDGIYLGGVRAIHYGGGSLWQRRLPPGAPPMGQAWDAPPRINVGFEREDEMEEIRSFGEMMPYLHTRHNEVRDNEVYDTVLTLNDGNAVYVACTGMDNVVSRNVIHGTPKFNFGVRFDADQYNTMVEYNVILGYGVKCKQFNTVRNNYLFGSPIGMNRKTDRGFVLERNLYYHTSAYDAIYSVNDDHKRSLARTLAVASPDRNLFWGERPNLVERMLEQAQQAGVDAGSRLGNPGFVRLGEGSLELENEGLLRALGIEPLSLEGKGLIGDEQGVRERFVRALEQISGNQGRGLNAGDSEIVD